MTETRRFPMHIPVAALLFAACHLGFEHFTGGVPSHHLFARPDMPAISNWFGLLILPALGVVLGLRVRAHPSSRRWADVPVSALVPLLGSLLYGAAMGASFSLGATNATTAAFVGLFVCGLVLPVYRAEYILGFVTGMSVTFGSVIPLLVASVVGTASFALRTGFGRITKAFREKRARPS